MILPKELAKTLQPKRLLAEAEWRALGVQQSRGWAHYAIHRPEPHILLFRRELGTDPMTGKVRTRRGGAPIAPTRGPRPHSPPSPPRPITAQVNPVLRTQAQDQYNADFNEAK